MNRPVARLLFVAFAMCCFAQLGLATTIVPTNFDGYGTVVSGYQDFFTEPSLNNGNWTEISGGASVTPGSSGNFTLSGGYLNINGGANDPNKLLYSGASYDSGNQNVLAMIEVTTVGSGDGFRGGIAAESNATTGAGINELFRVDSNEGTGNHTNLLNDGTSWGPAIQASSVTAPPTDIWSSNTFYWLREVTTSTGGANGLGMQTASIWPADGSTPESSALTASWSTVSGSLTGTNFARAGLAGLVADSSGGTGQFQVNYLLIQSPGLPNIDAGIVPEPSSIALLGLGAAGLFIAARRRRKT